MYEQYALFKTKHEGEKKETFIPKLIEKLKKVFFFLFLFYSNRI